MKFISYLIPILGAVLAIFSLFLDKNEKKFKVIAPILIIIIVVLGSIQVIDLRTSQKEANSQKIQTDKMVNLLDNVSVASAETSSYLSNILLAQPEILANYGLTRMRAGKELDQLSTSELEEGQILVADQYRTQLIKEKQPSRRQETQVWYYTKEIDTDQLRLALAGIGFKVTDKIATQSQANDPTNAVWHGPQVDLNDYKAVIVTLIRAGIDIRRVGPSCYNPELKRNVIEVGASDEAAGRVTGLIRPSKIIDSIRAATSFEQMDDFTTCPG